MPVQGHNAYQAAPAFAPLSKLLEQRLPGLCRVTRDLRERVLDFCFDLTARTVCLQGPIGAGKSTVARLIAFGKRVAPLREAEAEQLIANLRFSAPGLIDEKAMHWYVELPLTGLVETLAETQLFGIGKGTATSVVERTGVFELAQSGRRVSDGGAAIRITGGVVFLDEIAELSPALQAKLLPALSGGVFHRIGEEFRDLTFNGVTIAASWRDVSRFLRPDLFSRITDRIIVVPGLAERGDDVIALIHAIQQDLIARYRAQIDELARDGAVAPFWHEKALAIRPLESETVDRLAQVAWDSFGNMRGLTVALRRLLFAGKNVQEVVNSLQKVRIDGSEDSLLDQLFQRGADGRGLANHVHEIEREGRRRLRETLSTDRSTCERLLRHLGLDPAKAGHQVLQLDRSRKRLKQAASK